MVQSCSAPAVRSWALSGVPLSQRRRIVDTHTGIVLLEKASLQKGLGS